MKKLLIFLILAYLTFTINSRAITQDKKNSESEKILKIGVLLPCLENFKILENLF